MTTLVIVFVLAWVLLGLAAYWWLARRGHRSRWWLLLAVLLGPVLAATVKDRAEREPHALEHWQSGDQLGGCPRIVIGLDGSAESERALRSVLDLLPDGVGTLMLATVVDYDAPDEADADSRIARARERLAELEPSASRAGRAVSCEVLAGPPTEALLRCAADQQADLIVVGRRGHGMSTRLLGSVATNLVHKSPAPVLIGPPAVPAAGSREAADTRRLER